MPVKPRTGGATDAQLNCHPGVLDPVRRHIAARRVVPGVRDCRATRAALERPEGRAWRGADVTMTKRTRRAWGPGRKAAAARRTSGTNGTDGDGRTPAGRNGDTGDEGLAHGEGTVVDGDTWIGGSRWSDEGESRAGEEASPDEVPHERKRVAARARARANGATQENGSGLENGSAAGRPDGAAALTPAQLRRIEQRLLQERETALRTLVGTRTDIQKHRISDMRKEEMDIHLAERHSEFLALIDAALRRLREAPEDFHVSVVSGRPIPFERLEMVPWTRRLTSEMGLPAKWSQS